MFCKERFKGYNCESDLKLVEGHLKYVDRTFNDKLD